MEGLIFIIAIIIFAFLAMIFKSQGPASGALQSAPSKTSHDIPASLKAKWKSEENRRGSTNTSKSQTSKNRPSRPARNAAGQTGGSWARREQAEEARRQTRRDDHRTKAQQKAMARLGTGTPKDNNPNRRHDWGRRGQMGAGWLTPIIISFLSAGAVAVLFASN